jgi:ABC-type phosphate transport system auxiliary subunit
VKRPEQVIAELDALRAQIARNAVEIRDIELRATDDAEKYATEYATAYRRATGAIEERKQQATLDTTRFRAARDRSAIEVAFMKQRGRDIEAQQSNLQTQARLLDTHLRSIGINGRGPR